jgi:ATP-dependent Clp protease ATP-binding subunit ClpA
MLQYFVTHPGQVVTKEELFQAVWPQTVVSESTLASCIQELRQALRDDARHPRYIETVHRRGYRFLAAINAPPVPSAKWQVPSLHPAPGTQHPAPSFVGRETELRQLHGYLEKALRGERQLVFVTGEAGLGKTTVVDRFLAQLAADGRGLKRREGAD